MVRIPARADVVSDAVRLRFAAFQDLAVSVYVAESIAHPTEHLVTRQTSYLTPPGSGDHASDRIGEAFTGLTAASASISPPAHEQAGAFLGLLSAIGLAYGGFLSMREEGIAARDAPREIPVVRPGSENPS